VGLDEGQIRRYIREQENFNEHSGIRTEIDPWTLLKLPPLVAICDSNAPGYRDMPWNSERWFILSPSAEVFQILIISRSTDVSHQFSTRDDENA